MPSTVPRYIHLAPSHLAQKKFMAIFYDKRRHKIRTTHFGQRGASDFTLHKDPSRKIRYLKRHKTNENWGNAMSAGALSRWILWNKPSMHNSYRDYLRKFDLHEAKPEHMNAR